MQDHLRTVGNKFNNLSFSTDKRQRGELRVIGHFYFAAHDTMLYKKRVVNMAANRAVIYIFCSQSEDLKKKKKIPLPRTATK